MMESVDCEEDARNEIGTRCFIRTAEESFNGALYLSVRLLVTYQTFASLSQHPYRECLGRFVVIQDHIPRTETNRTRDGMRNNSKTEWIPSSCLASGRRARAFWRMRGGQRGRRRRGRVGVVAVHNVELVRGKNPNLARKGEVGKAAGVRWSR